MYDRYENCVIRSISSPYPIYYGRFYKCNLFYLSNGFCVGSYNFENVNFIALEAKEILEGVNESLVSRIVTNLSSGVTVCVHTSDLIANFDGFSEDSLVAELTRDKFAGMITDYLAELTRLVVSQIEVILITLGGETSYKCCKAIDSNELRLVDEVAPAISICSDLNNRWIITKSGNLGNSNTLIEILNYLVRHE